jgi:hypothetical protein
MSEFQTSQSHRTQIEGQIKIFEICGQIIIVKEAVKNQEIGVV